MKKGLILVGIMLCAAPCMAATLDLPPVQVDVCSTYIDIDSQAQQLLDLLAGFDIEGLPSYDTVDLENGMAGDGIPDKFQIALLSGLLCYGNATVQAQFDANEATFKTLVDDVAAVMGIALGNPPTTPTAADRLRSAVTILTPLVPTYIAQTVLDSMTNAATELDSFTASLPSAINAGSLSTLKTTLKEYSKAVAALMGLDTEIQNSVLSLLTTEIMGQITSIEAEVEGIIGEITPDLLAQITNQSDLALINGLVTDVGTIIDALDRTVALTQPGAIPVYGVTSKTTSEPFSALGDYDKNGYSNLTTYNSMKEDNNGNPPTPEAFVLAVSNPWSSVNPNVPVAGLFGLAALAGACLTGGAFAIRKK